MLTPQYRSAQGQQPYPSSTTHLTPTSREFQHDSVYGRPTSSVYSQPSPEAAVFAAHQLRNDIGRADPLEISPPSSPDIASPKEGPYPGDVSPIDDGVDSSQSAQERQANTGPRSNIPMMRRERRKNSDAVANALRESKSRDRTTPPRPYGHDVRWDPRTGEPTTGAKGRPSQVNPQEYAHDLTSRAAPASPSSQSKQAPQNPASFRDRLRPVRQASASPQPEPAPRPQWRGASGRTAIVDPVRDNKNVAKLKIPQRGGKTADRSVPVLSPIESNGSEATSSPLQVDGPNPSSPAQEKSRAAISGLPSSSGQSHSPDHVSHAQSSPVSSAHRALPLSEEAIQANRSLVQGSTAVASSQLRSLQVPSKDKAIRRKPARISSGQHPESSASSEHLPYNATTAPAASSPGPSSEWTQPPSRFSTTTYATSNHTSTPRVSADEEKPPLPTLHQPSTPTPIPNPAPEISILGRGRPTIPGYEDSPRLTPTESVKINLEPRFHKAAPDTKTMKTNTSGLHPLTRVIPEGNHSTLSVASVLSLDKSLPLAPPEFSAKDRVTELNAQLEALGNRRININTAIRKLTEMMPTDNILASEAVVRKREAEKRKVETLRTELADVERQSYELGLKLHRAYKRLDRNAEFEPTTLWVRRVTG
ncbi:hypothetical protein F5Y03DRAFT_397237 [Xylaria venustula]|nr:hypothetical protein F5Y03DRAFT_397237 [Xylaria venustula]